MRKLFLTTVVIALASMMGGATAANAAVARDGTTGQVCPAVTVSGDTATGGCLISSIGGTFTLQSSPTASPFDSCSALYNVRMNGSAVGYAVGQSVTCNYPLTECRNEATGQDRIWVIQGGQMSICLQTSSGVDVWYPAQTYQTAFGPQGQILGFWQTNPANGISNASFTNGGSTNEVRVTAN